MVPKRESKELFSKPQLPFWKQCHPITECTGCSISKILGSIEFPTLVLFMSVSFNLLVGFLKTLDQIANLLGNLLHGAIQIPLHPLLVGIQNPADEKADLDPEG